MPVRIKAFASHDWGKEQQTHKRVAKVVEQLRKYDIDIWFDETHMKGNILDAMCRGIDQSDVVLIFVTSNYIRKVQSGNENDNVRREFMYASQAPERLLVVRFDSELPNKWSGPVGMLLGSKLYVDLSREDTPVGELVRRIRNHTSRTTWKTAIKKVRSAPTLRETPPVLAVAATPASCPGLRTRFNTIASALGDQMSEEHIGRAVNRLFESLVGDPTGLPLVAKLERLELEVGVAKK